MDYFKQRRAYRNFKLYEASISNGQNNLYRELLDYANDEYKLDDLFSMKNSALLSLTGLSEAGMKKARNELVQMKLIKYVKGKKNTQAPQYQIIQLYKLNQGMATSWATSKGEKYPNKNGNSSSTGSDKVAQPVPQGEAQPEAHKDLTSTLPDGTVTKKNNDPFAKLLAESPQEPEDPRDKRRQEFTEQVWGIYPRQEKFGEAWEAYYRATITGNNPAGKTTKEAIIAGIEKYKRHLEVKGTQGQFIQQLANWLDNAGWLSNYDMTPPKQKSVQGGRAPRKELVPGWLKDDDAPKTEENDASVDRKALADRLAGLDAKRTENQSEG
ncbi:DNA replication protein DnaD [Lactiplantibacillus daowaiensis]|uniref:DNA replication protein DnaD n=1 Tax=Lactiplantibacillus daowaiensis TaxID=2559918 RepID=A0ABW1RY36_9LACO|nr:DNA replication protein DnaD [Lactiplantibacillus daowaiensis]